VRECVCVCVRECVCVCLCDLIPSEMRIGLFVVRPMTRKPSVVHIKCRRAGTLKDQARMGHTALQSSGQANAFQYHLHVEDMRMWREKAECVLLRDG
jgi:hypothetical protein